MNTRLIEIALACSLGVPASGAQDVLTAGAASDVGMSEAVLRAGAGLFEDAVGRDDLKGVVLLVARRGTIVLHEAYGWRDPEKTRAMEKDSLFRMASNTKPVIAAAVLQLAGASQLDLDDNAREHLPSFDNHRGAFITIRQLLSHTSGLRIGPIFLRPLVEASDEHPDAPSLQVEVARFGEIGAEVQPGTSYRYSNPGFNTLGALIEVASEMPLKQYLRERIYAPLGMVDSGNHESDADHARMSCVFRRGRDGAWGIDWQPGDPPDYPFPRASGGMISTARDYAVFCQTFLNGGVYGGERILGEAAVAEATSPQTRHVYTEQELAERESFYGFGWRVTSEGVYSHGGSDGTFAWVDPSRQIIGIVFTQSPGGANPRDQFRRVVEAACHDER